VPHWNRIQQVPQGGQVRRAARILARIGGLAAHLAALGGHPLQVAAQFQFLGQQGGAGLAVFGALIGEADRMFAAS
jgi:hypothetical protein